MKARSHKYWVNKQIQIAKDAIARFDRGELTELEKQIGCNAAKLAANWRDTLKRLIAEK